MIWGFWGFSEKRVLRFSKDDWGGEGSESGRALHDAHLSNDEAVAKVGHPNVGAWRLVGDEGVGFDLATIRPSRRWSTRMFGAWRLVGDEGVGFDLYVPAGIEKGGDYDHGGGWAGDREELLMDTGNHLPGL